MTLKELKAVQAKPGRKIVVIGPHVWGTGSDGNKAHANASRPKEWLAFDAHEKTWVDGVYGGLHIDGKDNPENEPAETLFIEIGRNVKVKVAAK